MMRSRRGPACAVAVTPSVRAMPTPRRLRKMLFIGQSPMQAGFLCGLSYCCDTLRGRPGRPHFSSVARLLLRQCRRPFSRGRRTMAMNKTHLTKVQKGVIGMLIDDHRKVQKLFKAFESEEDSARKQEMVMEACTENTAHAEIEEQHFYPSCATPTRKNLASCWTKPSWNMRAPKSSSNRSWP